MRLFLAVHPGEHWSGTLTTHLDRLRAEQRVGSALVWTRPARWHLTLHFLGEWPETRLSRLQTALTAAAEQPEFSLLASQLGAFPNWRRARVLFLQMEDDGELAKLAAAVCRIVQLAWPNASRDKRPFRAHLTLARVRGNLGQDELKLLENWDMGLFEPMSVTGFSLMASVQQDGRLCHRELAFYALRKKSE